MSRVEGKSENHCVVMVVILAEFLASDFGRGKLRVGPCMERAGWAVVPTSFLIRMPPCKASLGTAVPRASRRAEAAQA